MRKLSPVAGKVQSNFCKHHTFVQAFIQGEPTPTLIVGGGVTLLTNYNVTPPLPVIREEQIHTRIDAESSCVLITIYK